MVSYRGFETLSICRENSRILISLYNCRLFFFLAAFANAINTKFGRQHGNVTKQANAFAKMPFFVNKKGQQNFVGVLGVKK